MLSKQIYCQTTLLFTFTSFSWIGICNKKEDISELLLQKYDIYQERDLKQANFIPSFLITATGSLDHIKRDSDSLVLVGEGRRKIYQQWLIVFKVDNDEIVEAMLQFLLLHLSLLIKWALSEAQAHNKFNVTLFIPALNKVFTWSDDKCKVLG